MRKSVIKTQQGLTAIELLMGVLILSIFIMSLTGLLTFTAEQNKQIVGKVNQEIDTIIGEKMIFSDLKTAALSLNNISTLDDYGREFFDYIPDLASNAIPAAQARRELTMSAATAATRQLVVITLNQKESPPFMYDPTAAYTFTPPPANFANPGAFNFVSLNQNDYVNISQRVQSSAANYNFWRNGQLLFLDTPARIRPVPANLMINMRVPPRSSSILGIVNGAQFTQVVIPEVKRTHPSTNAIINNVNQFLTTVPPVGGAAPMVRMSAVIVVRYSVSPSPKNPAKVDLYREIHNGSNFVGRAVFATELDRVVFRRESIFHPLISFKLVYQM